MKKNNKEKNYRIFRVEEEQKDDLPKKITMMRIYAENDDDAYKQLKDYIKVANKEFTYYVECWSPCVKMINGKKYTYENYFEAYKDKLKRRAWYKKILDAIDTYFWFFFINRPKNIYYAIRNFIYLIKNKQQYCASYCIDDILLDTLVFNIPILKKYKHTYSWKMLEKAYLEKHSGLTSKDAKEYFSTHFSNYEENVENRSIELEHEMFDKLIEDIKTYRYYAGDYLLIDKNDSDLVETDKKLRHTLPLIKGSYECYDGKKLNALCEKYWNRIWETVRIYGREFND